MLKARLCIGRCLCVALIYALTACSSMTPPSDQGSAKSTTQEAPSPVRSNDDLVNEFFSALAHPQIQPPEVESQTGLVHALAQRFKKPEALIQRVVAAVTKFSHGSYPARDNVLAIIAVESSFNPQASYRGSKGLMQVNLSAHRNSLRGKNPFDIETNVSLGVSILSGYYEELGHSERGSVLAYNAGIGNFLKGRYNIKYYQKYRRELSYIRSITS